MGFNSGFKGLSRQLCQTEYIYFILFQYCLSIDIPSAVTMRELHFILVLSFYRRTICCKNERTAFYPLGMFISLIRALQYILYISLKNNSWLFFIMDTEFSLGGRKICLCITYFQMKASLHRTKKGICGPNDTCVFANLHSKVFFLFIFFTSSHDIFSYSRMFLVPAAFSNNSKCTAIYK